MNPKINTGTKPLLRTSIYLNMKSVSLVSLVQLNTGLAHLHFAWHQLLSGVHSNHPML